MPKSWTRRISVEAARLVVLTGLVACVSAIIGVFVTDTTFLDFFDDIHLDRDGRPMWVVFSRALEHSLPILVVAIILLALASMIFGSIELLPRLGGIKVVVMSVSALPSFLLPFLPSLLSPRISFQGLSDGGLWVPALCLAVGDCNLSTVTSHFRENLRTLRSAPHLMLIESLGQPVWLYIWPRASLTLLASISGRLPHLIGGLVAIELIFNIRGLGIAARDAVGNVPADLHWFFWICIFCVVARTVLRWGESILRSVWSGGSPDQPWLNQDEEDETFDGTVLSFSVGEVQHDSLDGNGLMGMPMISSDSPSAAPIGRSARLSRNLRFYLKLRPGNVIAAATATVICLAFLVMLSGIWMFGSPEAGPSLADPSPAYWLGTDAAGVGLVYSARVGSWQLLIPMTVAMMLGICAVPASLVALHRWIRHGYVRTILKLLDHGFVFAAEFIESLPKLLILLAAFSVVSGRTGEVQWMGMQIEINTMVLRLFALIGVLHAPQVYRAVREELVELNHPIYIESSLMTGTRWYQLIWNTIFCNRCLHVVCIEAAAIAAGVLHYDAVLGLVGVRGRGVIFTWGSSLGMGVESYMNFAGLEWFNPWVLAFPLLMVWMGITAFWILAETIKTLSGGYVYRLR